MLDGLAKLPQFVIDAARRGLSSAADYAYRGGARTKIWKEWNPSNRSGDAAIAEERELMHARVRELFRNEAVTRNLRRSIVKLVVGTGINTFAGVLEDDGENYFDQFNFESDELFERWAETEADVEGRLNWWTMQSLHLGETTESGTSLLLECHDPRPGRIIPLCYQLVEAEQLDTSKDRPSSTDGDGRRVNKIVGGIEYDRFNRPVAYWIYDVHPYDIFAEGFGNSSRIPAERVISTYLPNRPSEHRGVTWFSANIQSAKDMDWYMSNELTAAALGAALCLVVKRKNGAGRGLGFGETDSDEDGQSIVKLGKPFVADIGIDDEVSVAESSRPNRDAAPFIRLLLLLHGMAAGLSHLRVTGDYSQASYTSARGAHLDDDAYIQPLQRWYGSNTIRPVREKFNRVAAAMGRFRHVRPAEFARDEYFYQRMEVQPAGREQLDPEMETDAAAKRVRFGFSTHGRECGLRGRSFRRIVLEQKRERAFTIKHLGREFDLSSGGASKPGGPENRTAKTAEKATEGTDASAD